VSIFSSDCRTLIEGASLGTFGTDLFIGSGANIPTDDGPITQLRETGGGGPEHTHDGPVTGSYVFPSVQLIVKAADHDVAMARAVAISAVLSAVRNQLINATWYRRIRRLQEPFDVGQLDDSQRVQIVCNFVADKRP
jgi:hypothetical protein